ncbi:MAG: hypothetical protein A2666_01310 [Parcubacteria group bacterium RIFCSPHIGHO2_01_FULL_47_10b]|nr:MAG: hypothetical protein A2666_01310 [Parcubacteria group bacterium RIFCSPHIGHO2_01_FULL_47_10b]
MVMDADWRGAPTTDVAAVASKPPSPIKAIVTQQKTAPIKTTTLTTATPPEPSTPKPPKTSTTPNPAPVVPVVVTPANPLASVQTWVSYYAADQISKLSAFDLVEIDTEGGTDNYTQSDVKQLKDGGVIVVSYLNVGACETFRSYWKQCEKFKLAPYEGYPGEYWMDVTKSDYHTLLITAARAILDNGVQGFYLDNIDIYQEPLGGYNSKQLKEGVASIVTKLRAAFPNAIIIAQNGIYSPENNVLLYSSAVTGNKPLYTFIDAESHEEVFTNTDETAAIVEALVDLRSKGVPVFNLEYPEPLNATSAQEIIDRSRALGFIPYVSDVGLDTVYNYSL